MGQLRGGMTLNSLALITLILWSSTTAAQIPQLPLPKLPPINLFGNSEAPAEKNETLTTVKNNDETRPISILADSVQGWTEPAHQLAVVRGNVSIQQGLSRVRAKNAAVWMSRPPENKPDEVVEVFIFAEGDVIFEDRGGPKQNLSKIALQWKSQGEIRYKAQEQLGKPEQGDEFFQRAMQAKFAGTVPDSPRPQDETGKTPAKLTSRPIDTEASTETSKETKTAFGQPVPAGTDPRLPPGQFQLPTVGVMPGGDGMIRVPGNDGSVLFTSRNGGTPNVRIYRSGNNEYAAQIWGGLVVYSGDERGVIDLNCDRAIVWIKGINTGGGIRGVPDLNGLKKENIELYLEGHVEIRGKKLVGPDAGFTQKLYADRAYYDLGRSVALLQNSEIVYTLPGVIFPIHVQAAEMRQVNPERFEMSQAVFFASRLPSDPDLKVMTGELSVTTGQVPRRGPFNTRPVDEFGNDLGMEQQLWGSAESLRIDYLGLPIGYLSQVEGDLRDPLGPIVDVRVRGDRVFGYGLQVGLDAFQLFGLEKPTNTRWRIDPFYYNRRGPGITTEISTSGEGLFEIPGRFESRLLGMAMYDAADTDILGGPRRLNVPSEFRGRMQLAHRQELGNNWTFLGQLSYLSDRNFLEQWRKFEFETALNQETFAYLKWQEDTLALTGLVKPNIRRWVNEGEALPRVDGRIIGQDFFDLFTVFSHASAGLYRFHPTNDLPPGFVVPPPASDFLRYRDLPPSSDMPRTNAFFLFRGDWNSEVDLPLHAGPFGITPYGMLDLAYYSRGMDGEEAGRVLYGGGVRGALPLSKLYSDVRNDFFYVRGIMHKVSLEADYRYVASNTDFRRLPLLDRLDDDSTDQARRDLRLYRLATMSKLNLATSPLYDPQLYALRSGYTGSPDNIDDVQYLRGGIRNRWQTKRGAGETEHVVDWMSLDIFGSFFPNQGRDNYGNPFGLIDVDYVWNIGERTTLVGNANIDPFAGGGKAFNIGLLIEKTERLRYYVGFTSIQPTGTAAFTFSSSYIINPKYSVSWSSSYDFGLRRSLGHSVFVNRTGSDLQFGLGVTYDALRNSVGLSFDIYPTIAGPSRHMRRIAPGLSGHFDPLVDPY